MTEVHDIEIAEIQSLENEFQWMLKHEVAQVFKSLDSVLTKCYSKFPMSMSGGVERAGEPEKFVLTTPSTTPTDQVKVVVTLTGDAISHADINLKLPRPSGGKDLYANTSVREDSPWQLQQIQDAANHLSQALSQLKSAKTDFTSGTELTNFLTRLMACIQRSRASLVNPKKRTLEELRTSKQVRGLVPPIPAELVLSFYLQSWRLTLAVYHIVADPKSNTSKFNRYQAECVVPWVNEVLLLLTIGLQTMQQLKDKVNVFSQYQDFPPQSPI